MGCAMAFSHHFKPAHKEIKAYYEALAAYAGQQVSHEGATSTAFQNLLAATCKKADWHLVPQLATKIRGKQVRPDGTLRDDLNLHRGYWETKDSGDKLDAEIRKKIALGYPLSNTILEDRQHQWRFAKVTQINTVVKTFTAVDKWLMSRIHSQYRGWGTPSSLTTCGTKELFLFYPMPISGIGVMLRRDVAA